MGVLLQPMRVRKTTPPGAIGNASRSLLFLWLSVALIAPIPGRAGAQCAPGGNQYVSPEICSGYDPSGASGALARRYLAVNVGIGAATAGISSWARGGSFWRGLSEGALGGALVYFGKRTIVSRSRFGGLTGREIGAVGSSIVQNASLEKPMLDRFIFPLGPSRLYMKIGDSGGVRLKIDLAGTVAAIYAATRPRSRLDIPASLSAGAPVFISPGSAEGPAWYGAQIAGVIQVTDAPAFLRNNPSGRRQWQSDVTAHELVHVAQYDFSFIAWTETPETALVRRAPRGARISRHVDFGLNEPVWLVINGLIPYEKRPWEREAFYFGR